MLQATLAGQNRHRLLVPDPGLRLLREYDSDGNVVFELNTGGLCYDAWKLPDGSLLYAYISPDALHGVVHCTPDGTCLTRYETDSQVFSCQPLPDDAFLVGELQARRLTEVGRDGRVQRVIPIQSSCSGHNTMRMCRRCPDGTYLVNQPDDKAIRRYDADGRLLTDIRTPGDTFAVIPAANGNVYYTAQREITLAAPDGHPLWRATEQELAAITPCWLTGMELLQNGNLLVVNWLGHGMAGKGAAIFEITPDKQIVFTLSAPDFTDCQANIQCLDEDAAAVIASPLR